MPDLMVIHVRVCASNMHLSKVVKGSKGDEYQVSFDYRSGWSCTCPAFKFHSNKHCKHILAVESTKCDWNHEAISGSGDMEFNGDVCPNCGDETEVVAIGV